MSVSSDYSRARAQECRKGMTVIAACQLQIQKLNDPEEGGDPTNEGERILLWLEESLHMAGLRMELEMSAWANLALEQDKGPVV